MRNHPLVDGNKRLGWLATAVFLDLNGCPIEGPDDDVYDLVVGVAAGEHRIEDIASTLATWAR